MKANFFFSIFQWIVDGVRSHDFRSFALDGRQTEISAQQNQPMFTSRRYDYSLFLLFLCFWRVFIVAASQPIIFIFNANLMHISNTFFFWMYVYMCSIIFSMKFAARRPGSLKYSIQFVNSIDLDDVIVRCMLFFWRHNKIVMIYAQCSISNASRSNVQTTEQ